MNNKTFYVIMILITMTSFLFGYEVGLPEQILDRQSVTVNLSSESGDPEIASVRFYLLQDIEEPLFLSLEESLGLWSAIIPGAYIVGEKMHYFVEVQSSDGYVRRLPQRDSYEKIVHPDNTPPSFTLVAPEVSTFILGESQVILVSAEGEESLEVKEFLIDGRPVEDVISFGSFIKGVYTPERNRAGSISITAVDAAGNEGSSEIPFKVTGSRRGPFFTASIDGYANTEFSYELNGEQEGLELPGELLGELSYTVEHEFSAGTSISLGAGPIELSARVDLGDDRDLLEYLEDYDSIIDYPYPSALTSDLYEFLRLYNPYEYNYSSGLWTHGRDFESDNTYLVGLSIFDEALLYRLGDQSISFQEQTVNNMPLRGSYFEMDIPLLTIRAGNGLIDGGLSEVAWPRHFAGVQVGLDLFDYWYLQTNLSLIADYQGSYEDIKGGDPDENAIAILYDLIDPDDSSSYLVDPQQNLVLGLGTGIDTGWLELTGEAGLSLYVSDAGTVSDIEALVGAFGVDESLITPYTGYIDTIQGLFPLFDYFPISLGLAYDALDLSLWGLTYGAELKIPDIGIKGWFHKTDDSYKSLGSSITTGMQQVGGLWEIGLGDWDLDVGYNWDTANIPDILLSEVLPIIEGFVSMPALVSGILDTLTTSTILPEVSHEAAISLSSPSLGYFGRLSLGGSFSWEFTDTDGDTGSSDYQEAYIIGGVVSWRSKTLKVGKFSFGLDAKSDDSYTIHLFTDGVSDTDTEWDFDVSGGMKLGFGAVSLSLGYGRDWGTGVDSDTCHEMNGTLTVKDIWFDSVSISADWDETFDSSDVWSEREVSGKLKLKKSFGALYTGLEITGEFTDAVDAASDESAWDAKIWGGVSF